MKPHDRFSGRWPSMIVPERSKVWSIVIVVLVVHRSSLVHCNSTPATFHLDGTPNSYLQFPSWAHLFADTGPPTTTTTNDQSPPPPLPPHNKPEATLSFEFRCAWPESWSSSVGGGGLLLYTDHSTGPGGVFVEVKLLSETNLRVRIDDGAGVRVKNIVELRQEINFTDGQWHRFELIRHFQPLHSLEQPYTSSDGGGDSEDDSVKIAERSESITVKVDKEVIHKRIDLSASKHSIAPVSESINLNLHHLSGSVFVGGVPTHYRTSGALLGHLALPTVAYELHFRGAIRNVLYAAAAVTTTTTDSGDSKHSGDYRMQHPLAHSGTLTDSVFGPNNNIHLHTVHSSSECSTRPDRCQHGGVCYPTQSGFYCDCSATEFEGPLCQKERLTLEATFRGTPNEYLGANQVDLPNAWSFVSTAEHFEVSFRTRTANGLLLFTSDQHQEDYLVVAMKDAGIELAMRLGGETVHRSTVRPSKVRFDDHQWHTVTVDRKIREISPSTYFCHYSLTVDGIYTQHGSTAGIVPYFVSKVFYVGGLVHDSALAATVESSITTTTTGATADDQSATKSAVGGHGFVGCLRKIIYVADNVRLDLLSLVNDQHHQHHHLQHPRTQQHTGDSDPSKSSHASSNHSSVLGGLIRLYGDSHSSTRGGYGHQSSLSPLMCHDVDASDPVTFTTEDSYLKVDTEGWNTPQEGAVALKVRTTEPNGVLLYSVGSVATNAPRTNNHSAVQSHDFFALELLDGHLYVLQHLGSSPVKVKATERPVNDGYWHSITVRRSGRSGQVVVDGDTVSDFVSPGHSNRLDLGEALYLGGYPRHTGDTGGRLTYTPPQLWSAALATGYGYVGCVRDLTLNDRAVDLAALAKRQDSGSVKRSCHSSPAQCQSTQPCQNGGQCVEGWNRYTCRCTHTAYTGSACAKNAATLNFNGEQYLTINLPEELQTQAESVYLRFRTTKPNGLLLTTVHGRDPTQHLTVVLESGVVRVDLNYGEGHRVDRIVQIGAALNDDAWHSVHIERRGHNLELELDQTARQVVELTGQHYTLHISAIHVGARVNIPKAPHATHYPGFVGHMQNFVFNGQAYFEKTRDGQLSAGSIRLTAKLGKKERILHNQATFKSKYTFVGLPQLKAYSRLNIYFQFKTREANGLIFFNGGGQRHDFVAAELVNGHLHYVFDLGDGPRRLQSRSRVTLNDNRWHTVTVGRPSLHQHTMLIDDQLMTNGGGGNGASATATDRNLHLDLDGLLYFGGVRDTMWATLPKAIRSRHGFEGCIASLDLNGETYNLAAATEVLIPSTLVESGCSAPLTRCSSTACANRGICVQLWNSYTCDCDLTTFSGPTCADGNESTAYQFGPGPGLVMFAFDENNRPDTRNDLLALGFLTTQKNGALVRVDSGTTADYLQLELLDGHVLVVYNLGTEDIDIGELGIKVNDGRYHIVRLTRSGQNSTLQIDNHNVLTRSPTGKQMNIFNSHAKIEIGGHKNILRGTVEKPFGGIIAGLVFNGHRLLDMAAEDDPRVKVEGDVELMISIGNQDTVLTTPSSDQLSNQMLSEPKSSSSSYGHGDDLIYSGAGSGCFDVNDDEECAHMTQEGSGDDLITPVYVGVHSRSRSTTPAPANNGRNVGRKPCQNDDDDDCGVEGSGAAPYDSDPDQSNRHYPGLNQSVYNNNNNNPYDYNNNYGVSSTSQPWTTWVPPTVAPMNRPPLQPPHFYNTALPPFYTNGHYGSDYHNPDQVQYVRPKTTAPSWTKPMYSVSGPSRTIPAGTGHSGYPSSGDPDSQEPPEILDVPLNLPPVTANDSDSAEPPVPLPPEVLSRANNDRTVMIIGMIAICLIVVVIIAPIVLFFKVRLQATDAAAYKVETFGGGGPNGNKFFSTLPVQGSGGGGGHSIGYPPGFSPVVRATSVSGITGHPGGGPHGGLLPINSLGRSMSRPGTRPGTPTDIMKKKDPHEWYV